MILLVFSGTTPHYYSYSLEHSRSYYVNCGRIQLFNVLGDNIQLVQILMKTMGDSWILRNLKLNFPNIVLATIGVLLTGNAARFSFPLVFPSFIGFAVFDRIILQAVHQSPENLVAN
jgi:hypothetical protein